MKRVVVQLTIELPVDDDAIANIRLMGGQDVTCADMKKISEEDLGDVIPAHLQKKNEFLTVRQIIQDGLKAAMPKLALRVYGSRQGEEFTFWCEIGLKARDYNKVIPPHDLRVMTQKFAGYTFMVHKGTLVWNRPNNAGRGPSMSLGNPDIVKEIENHARKLIT
jgi:hypothetical protein